MPDKQSDILVVEDLEPVFFELLREANRTQSADVSDFALRYIAKMMVNFTNPENLFQTTEEGLDLQPLALIFKETVGKKGHEKTAILKKLGDSALYRAGFMADYYKRKPVDIDYCIKMGQSAYSSISNTIEESKVYDGPEEEGLYHELTHKFSSCVDILSEVAEKSKPNANNDLSRLYETWMRTDSKRTEKILQEKGHNIIPANNMKLN